LGIALANQPRQASRRQARWTSPVPPRIEGILDQKVRALFASARSSGVYEYVRPERRVPMDQTPMLLMLLELWESQDGRCGYCRINLETAGLAQVSIDRIDNDDREYGRHNVHLTCWECNGGKGAATHEEMIGLWEKRKLVWSSQATNGRIVADCSLG
jgi:5-methylcytosine-specific restriction endonuclease McrA